jgi:hypothetical protein
VSEGVAELGLSARSAASECSQASSGCIRSSQHMDRTLKERGARRQGRRGIEPGGWVLTVLIRFDEQLPGKSWMFSWPAVLWR